MLSDLYYSTFYFEFFLQMFLSCVRFLRGRVAALTPLRHDPALRIFADCLGYRQWNGVFA
jgi:hypothetical protein